MVKMPRNRSTGDLEMSANQGQLTEMVQKKAYELYEKRGRKQGHAMDDWLKAERIVKQRSF